MEIKIYENIMKFLVRTMSFALVAVCLTFISYFYFDYLKNSSRIESIMLMNEKAVEEQMNSEKIRRR